MVGVGYAFACVCLLFWVAVQKMLCKSQKVGTDGKSSDSSANYRHTTALRDLRIVS